jgi:hypothetical protein
MRIKLNLSFRGGDRHPQQAVGPRRLELAYSLDRVGLAGAPRRTLVTCYDRARKRTTSPSKLD